MGKFDTRATFGIDFKVNKVELDALKKDLAALKSISLNDFMAMNKDLSLNEAKKQLLEIKDHSMQVQRALTNAFNTDLGVVNISRLNLELKKLPVNDIYRSFQRAGAAGISAFNTISSSIMKSNLQLKESHSLLDKIGTTFMNTVRFGLASSVFNRMTDSIQRSWEFTKQLDTSLNDIRIVTGKSADEMERYAKVANNAAKNLGATTQDYVKSSLIYYQQGLSDEETQARSDVTVKTANVTGQQASTVSEQLTAIWNGYKVDAAEAELYIDKVAKVAATTAADLEEMATGMSKVASAANSAGVDIDQLNAMLATVISVTREAPETIGTSFRTIFARLGDLKKGGTDENGLGLGQISEKVHEFGIDILDTNGDLREMGDVITDIAAKWETLSRGERQALAVAAAGKQQYSRFIALFDNWDMYTKALNDSKTASGELQKQQDIYMESTEAHLNQLTAAQERVGDAFFNSKSMNGLIDVLTGLTTGFAHLIESIGGGGNALLAFGGIATRVLDKQIAQSINTSISNAQVYKYNLEQLRTQMEALERLHIAAPGDKGTEIRYNAKQQMQSYVGVLSKEQIEEYDKTIDEYGNAVAKLEAYNQQREQAESFITRQFNSDKRFDTKSNTGDILSGKQQAGDLGYDKYAETAENTTIRLEQLEQTIGNVKKAYQDYGNTVQEVFSKTEQQKIDIGSIDDLDKINAKGYEAKDMYDLYAEAIEKVEKEIKELTSDSSALSEGQKKILQELINKWNELDKTTGAYGKGASKKAIKVFDDMAKSANKATESYKNEAKETENFLKQEGENAYQTKIKFQELVEEKRRLWDQQNTEGMRLINIKNITDAVGMVQSLSSVMLSLKNLGSIWNNENLSTGEKILQTTLNVSMSLLQLMPLLTSAFTALNAQKRIAAAIEAANLPIQGKANVQLIENAILQKHLNQAIAEGVVSKTATVATLTAEQKAHILNGMATTEEAAALGIAKGAQDAFNASALANPYLWIVLAVVAAITAIALAIKAASDANNASAESARMATEHAQEMKTAFEEAEKAAQELKETISSWDEAYKNIDNLVKGTTEYQEAVKEANKQAKELIETLDLIEGKDYEYDGRGVIKFKDGILETKQEESNQKVTEANRMKNISEITANEAQMNYSIDKFAEKIGAVYSKNGVYAEGSYWSDGGWGQRELTEDSIMGVVNGLIDLGKEIDLMTDDQLRDAIQGLDNLTPAAKQMTEQFIKQRDSLEELINSQKTATDENYRLAKELMKLTIHEKYGSDLEKFNTDSYGRVDTVKTDLMEQILTIKNDEKTKKEQQNLQNYGDKISKIDSNDKFRKFLKDDLQVGDGGISWEGDDDKVLALEYAKKVKKATGNLTYSTDDGGWGHGSVTDSQGNKVVDKLDDNVMRKGLAEYYAMEKIKSNMSGDINLDEFENKLKSMTQKATEFGKQYGIDFSTSMLSAMANKSAELDFSSLFSRIDPDEYKELANLSQEDLLNHFGLDEETLKQTAWQSGENFYKSFKEGLSSYQWDMSDAIDAAMQDINSDLEQKGLSNNKFEQYSDEVKQYAENLMVTQQEQERFNESADGVSNSLKYNAEAATKVAYSVIKMNKAIDTLADNMEDWSSIIKKSSKTSQESAEAYRGVASALADIYNTESEYISNSFIKDHLKEIEKVAKGDAAAIEKLRNELSKDILVNIIAINKIDSADIKNQLMNDLQSIQDSIGKIEVGATIDLNSDQLNADEQKIANAMQRIVNNANMTKEQANAIFSQIGFDAEFETEMKPVDKWGASTITQTRILKSENLPTITDQDGNVIQNLKASATETFTTKGTPYKYTDYVEAVAMGTTTPDGKGRKPKIKSLTKTGTGSMNNYSATNPGGKGPGKTSGGGGSKSKPKKEKHLDDEYDRYHKVNTQLEKIDNNLKKIQSQEKKFIGTKLINNLNGQLDKLDKRLDNLRKKEKIAYGEQDELAKKLGAQGVKFNDDGTISNYMQILEAKKNEYNALVDQYNSLSAEEQEKWDDNETLSKAKEKYEKFKENLDRYDELVSDFIPGIQQEIQDAIDEEIEINIKKFNLEFEVKLDIAEAKKDWNEFKRKILDDIDDDDILGNARARATDDLGVYLSGTDGKDGLLGAGVKQTQSILKELKDMDEKGWSNVYGDDRVSALEDLQEAYQNVEQSLMEIKEIQEDVAQAVLDQMDAVVDAMDKVADLMDTVDSQIEHDIKVIEMVYGETDYDAKGKYMEKRQKNNLDTLGTARENRDYWEQQMNLIDDKTSEAYQKAQENFFKYNDAVNDAIEKSIEDAQEKAENAIDGIFKKYNDEITNGKGLDYTEQQWELVNDVADQYLDTVNAAFGIRQLEGKWKDAIDNTDNVGAQRKLNDLMEKQLKQLREKDKLTEYDIERAEKEYEIALKKLALEEAQQTKSTMRLRRDSQGNYRYEYVADEDQIAKLQDELDALENSLYNFDKERWLEMQNQVIDAVRDRQDAIKEILMDASLSEEERLERLEEINKLYNEKIQNITDQAVTAQTNLYDSGATELSKIWDEQGKDFQDLSDEEQRVLVEEMLPQFETGVNDMIDKFSGPGGFEDTTTDSMDALSQATQDYQDDLGDVEDQAGITFDEIRDGQDDVLDAMPDMIDDAEDYVDVMQDELSELQDINAELQKKLLYYQQISVAAKAAATEAYNYWLKEQQIAAEKYAQENAKKNNNAGGNNGNTGSGGSGSGGSGNGGKVTLSQYDAIGVAAAISLGDNYGGWGTDPGRKAKLAAKFTNDNDVQAVINRNGGHLNKTGEFNAYRGKLRDYYYDRFNTGGYTGEWVGNYGKLGVLDSKELVLNAHDTENMLDMLAITRDVVSMAGPRFGLSKIMTPNTDAEVLEQNVHIEANFPAAESAEEIKEAINSLVNLAAQRASRNGRG